MKYYIFQLTQFTCKNETDQFNVESDWLPNTQGNSWLVAKYEGTY